MTTMIIPSPDGWQMGHWQPPWPANDPTPKPAHLSELGNTGPEGSKQELLSAIMENPGATMAGHCLSAMLMTGG